MSTNHRWFFSDSECLSCPPIISGGLPTDSVYYENLRESSFFETNERLVARRHGRKIGHVG